MKKIKAKIFVISGPSGSGKTTLAKKLLEDKTLKSKLTRLVSFTTRPKRPAEKNGQDYAFISQSEFLKKRGQKKFLEWTKYLGYYYATAKMSLKKALRAGKNIVLCVDQRGAFKIKRLYPQQARLVFILPPDLKTIEKRIILRASSRAPEYREEIKQRLDLADEEIRQAHKYDYRIVNNDLNKALGELKDIVRREVR